MRASRARSEARSVASSFSSRFTFSLASASARSRTRAAISHSFSRSSTERARASLRAANSGLREAEGVLTLTESLYKAGRANLDDLEHARIDLQKIAAERTALTSETALAAWDVERTLRPARFRRL